MGWGGWFAGEAVTGGTAAGGALWVGAEAGGTAAGWGVVDRSGGRRPPRCSREGRFDWMAPPI